MSKDYQMKAAINQKMIEMGERERLKELLRAKLVESGWKDQLKAHCKDVIREKGLEHVTVEDLVTEVTPKGRALVPDSVKKELLQRIRAFLAQHAALGFWLTPIHSPGFSKSTFSGLKCAAAEERSR
ncbi:hypothetical protein OJAV_G00110360 [Oryzias javanicus]|uniref:Transcription and mRNA export factor ENY2 n=1 Tax=Oryzias javanicus TaxID=123683 RepID=A0A437CVD9_ORYJA|nr:hypothetical protein OJAV_G00110360 [Oryzias javanicus]